MGKCGLLGFRPSFELSLADYGRSSGSGGSASSSNGVVCPLPDGPNVESLRTAIKVRMHRLAWE